MFRRTEMEIKKSGCNLTLSLKPLLDEPVEISTSQLEMGVRAPWTKGNKSYKSGNKGPYI